jgi:hypothetical protein
MHLESVEIFSDATNAAVMRHPGRRFPGVLVQGDTLHALARSADKACKAARVVIAEDDYIGLNDLRNDLWDLVNHYKRVLAEHSIPLPFSDMPR